MSSLISRSVIGAVIIASVVGGGAAAARTIEATAVTLASAWAAAQPGDTIKLKGIFGETRLQYKSSAVAVTLDASKAVFTDTLVINQVDGLNIVGGHFGSATNDTTYGRAVVVYGGSNISFSKPVVIGNEGGQGISINDTVNASVYSGSFTNLGAALGIARVTGGTFSGNKIVGAVSDGIDIADSHMVMASYNSCSDGAPGAGVHPDCIQLWSVAGHAVQSDITLSHNTANGPTQGFTSFDPAKGGGLRITMLHNTVYSTYAQGIACYACVDSNISYNSVRTMPGAASVTNIHIVGGSNNFVNGNTIGAKPALNASSAALSRFAVATKSDDSRAGAVISDGTGVVPEPDTWALLVAGFGVVGIARRRSRRFGLEL